MASMKDMSMLDPEKTRRLEDIDRKISEVFADTEDENLVNPTHR